MGLVHALRLMKQDAIETISERVSGKAACLPEEVTLELRPERNQLSE